MNRTILIILTAAVFAQGCKTFIREDQILKFRDMEKVEYVLLNDLAVGDKVLKKDDVVKIVISKGSDWIKAEVYSVRIGKLKADRLRILYLFEDDFPDKKFNMEFFIGRIQSVIKIK